MSRPGSRPVSRQNSNEQEQHVRSAPTLRSNRSKEQFKSSLTIRSNQSKDSTIRSQESSISGSFRARHLLKQASKNIQDVLFEVGDFAVAPTDDYELPSSPGPSLPMCRSRSFDDYVDKPTSRKTIVSAKAPGGQYEFFRFRVRMVIRSRAFDMFIGMIIIANSVSIGYEMSLELEGKPTHVLQMLEEAWLVIYIIELVLRIVGWGMVVWKDPWVQFDTLLVIIGVLNIWLIALVQAQPDQLSFLMVLRLMRLGRLARTLRLLIKFKVLWMLVRGLLTSAGTMFYTFVLVSIMLYVFGAMAIELITNNTLVQTDEKFGEIVQGNFRNLPETMLTLMQFACLDSIGAIYRPLIQREPFLVFYFTGVILVVPIVLMNLVTAIIVNSALDQAAADKEVAKVYEEQRKARLVKQLKDIFLRLDADNSGQITREEIATIGSRDRNILMNATSIADPIEVFRALDVDECDSLSIDDFCDGIWKLATSKAGIEVLKMENQVNIMFQRLKGMEVSQVDTSSTMMRIEKNQENMRKLLASADSTIKQLLGTSGQQLDGAGQATAIRRAQTAFVTSGSQPGTPTSAAPPDVTGLPIDRLPSLRGHRAVSASGSFCGSDTIAPRPTVASRASSTESLQAGAPVTDEALSPAVALLGDTLASVGVGGSSVIVRSDGSVVAEVRDLDKADALVKEENEGIDEARGDDDDDFAFAPRELQASLGESPDREVPEDDEEAAPTSPRSTSPRRSRSFSSPLPLCAPAVPEPSDSPAPLPTSSRPLLLVEREC